MMDGCTCEPVERLIFPCSGGSNVGQIANEAAKALTVADIGKMYCLGGIGGHVSAITESTKAAKLIVAIDGCPVQCARKTLEHAGFKPSVHVIATELGIKKQPGFDMKQEEIDRVVEKVSTEIESPCAMKRDDG